MVKTKEFAYQTPSEIKQNTGSFLPTHPWWWALGLIFPDRFAALVPFMGYYAWPFTVPENICDIKDIPVWAFHGDADEVVPIEAEQIIVDALESCGGDIQFTIFPGVGHDLDYSLIYNSDLYEWLLSHTRKIE